MALPLHGNQPTPGPERRAHGLRGYYAILDVRARPGAEEPVEVAAEVMRAEQLLAARPCCLQLRAKQLPVRPAAGAGHPAGAAVPAGGGPLLRERPAGPGAGGAGRRRPPGAGRPVARPTRAACWPRWGAASLWASRPTRWPRPRRPSRGGADYIGFGPVFATGSKERPDPGGGTGGAARGGGGGADAGGGHRRHPARATSPRSWPRVPRRPRSSPISRTRTTAWRPPAR